MNKNIFYIGFIWICICSFNVWADDEHAVTINITANIIDSTCTIDNTTPAVDMGDVNAKGIAMNTPFGTQVFTISLSDCPETISTATVTFSSIDGSSSYINNTTTASDGAVGYVISLYDLDNNFIDLLNNSTLFNIDSSQGVSNFELKFQAAFLRIVESTAAKVGSFAGAANFIIDYA